MNLLLGSCIVLSATLPDQVCCTIASGVWQSAASAWLPRKLPATATIPCSMGKSTVVAFVRERIFFKQAAPKVMEGPTAQSF